MDVPESVVEDCKRGDPAAFAELVRVSHREVYSLAYRITGNREDAADVAQETFMRLLRTIKQFRGEAKFSTWLYRVTSSVAISHMRKKSRKAGLDLSMEDEEWRAIPAAESADPAYAAQQSSVRRLLESALGGLPYSSRIVVVMKDVYGFSLQEIGDQLGISEGAVKVRLFRARRRLRDAMLKEGWSPEMDVPEQAAATGDTGVAR